MTPMVDLGFLLITFFVFTTTISTPTVTDLYMPKDTNKDSSLLINELALTMLLSDNNKIYCYAGAFEDAVKANAIFETGFSTYSGIGKIIRQRQKDVEASGKFTEGKRGLMLLVKPTSESVYKNVVDALDEALINDVRKYAILEPSNEEIHFLERSND